MGHLFALVIIISVFIIIIRIIIIIIINILVSLLYFVLFFYFSCAPDCDWPTQSYHACDDQIMAY